MTGSHHSSEVNDAIGHLNQCRDGFIPSVHQDRIFSSDLSRYPAPSRFARMKMFKSPGFWQYSAVIGFLGVTVVNPRDFLTWLIEITGIIAGLVLLLWVWRKGIRLSPLLSWFLVIHAFILIYGAWHTYSRAPLGQMWSEWFGWERNHYDRLAHFAQGFFPAVLIREVLIRNNVVNGTWWREFIVFACAMASAGLFELIEFAAAVSLGDGTIAYLGSQGDVWDAQWDMLYCCIGAIASIAFLSRRHYFELASHVVQAT